MNNGNEKNGPIGNEKRFLVNINLKMEEEISELSEKEREELKMEVNLDQIVIACYNILDLITFYTVAGGKETRAWTLKKGGNTLKAEV
jgi:ribosome-binding ATPase YchF (GTP1/OBG family)